MQPNILLIMTDQHRADHVGFGGNQQVRTPNLDRLAEQSRVFDRAYVANPICMPNRCSILTGRMPTSHGVLFNDRSLPPNANTFVKLLAKNGYHTGLVGKAHIQYGMSRFTARPMEKEPAFADVFEEGWDTLEHPDRYLDEAPVIDDFYGFKEVEFSIGHGDAVGGHHYRWARDKGASHEELTSREPLKQSDSWWQVRQPSLPEEYYSTTFIAERSAAFIAEQSNEQPWFLQCSFPDPHHPFTPPGKWWDAYDPADMQLPDSFSQPLGEVPAHLKLFHSFDARGNPVQMFGINETQLREALAAQYGMIEMIDEAIGQVLQALEASGQADNTYVIFTSDHGDMFGDHGLMLKGVMHYEGCIRVPMTVKGPEINPARSSSLVSSLDIAQTVLALTGLEEFDHMQGVSMAPVLSDPTASVRDQVFIEEDLPMNEHVARVPHKVRTLVTETHRTTLYSSGEKEVYNLTNDPGELHNLAMLEPASEEVRQASDRLALAMLNATDLSRLNRQ